MKIIARAANSFVFMATEDETAKLVGYKYDSGIHLKIGDEINISEMYNQLYDLSSYEEELIKVQKQLRRLANKLKVPAPLTETSLEDS